MRQKYPCFPQIPASELFMSRLDQNPIFHSLAIEIQLFNADAKSWTTKQQREKYTLIYALHKNLFARMKCISNHVRGTNSHQQINLKNNLLPSSNPHFFNPQKYKAGAKQPQNLNRIKIDSRNIQIQSNDSVIPVKIILAVRELAKWWQQQKESLRKNAQPRTTNISKQSKIDVFQQVFEDQTKQRQDEEENNYPLHRTAHPQIDPPLERLGDFKRKTLLKSNQDQINNNQTNFTVAGTISNKKNSTTVTRLPAPELQININSFEQDEHKIEEINLQNQEATQQIDQNIGQAQIAKQGGQENDQQDQHQSNQESQQQTKCVQKKLYIVNLKKKQDVKAKFENLDMKNQLLLQLQNEARQQTRSNAISQRRMYANHGQKLNWRKSSQHKTQSNPAVFEMKVLSARTPTIIQQSVEKLRIRRTLSTFGRFINHVQTSERAISTAPTLTSLVQTAPEKKQFLTQTIRTHGTNFYNQKSMIETVRAKNKLALKQIQVPVQKVFNGLKIPEPENISATYPSKPSLLSNPFFPKHLYASAPKRK